ncbi:hypothetical protein M405DRAFT_174272 [Rhizopogon salebrosus TDB-379]|nr:hypothetical protein M405DRAFT_174272 [Rhizopogon salebrosus TDB-379]
MPTTTTTSATDTATATAATLPTVTEATADGMDPVNVFPGAQAVSSLVGVAANVLLDPVTVMVTVTNSAPPAITSLSAPVTTIFSTSGMDITPATDTTDTTTTTRPTTTETTMVNAENCDEDDQRYPDSKPNIGSRGLLHQDKVRAVRRRAIQH